MPHGVGYKMPAGCGFDKDLAKQIKTGDPKAMSGTSKKQMKGHKAKKRGNPHY